MFRNGGSGARERRKSGTPHRNDRAGINPKAVVMAFISRLVSDGRAEFGKRANGDIELRFSSGEVFQLHDAGITRVG
jgi:hypothetical protein